MRVRVKWMDSLTHRPLLEQMTTVRKFRAGSTARPAAHKIEAEINSSGVYVDDSDSVRIEVRRIEDD